MHSATPISGRYFAWGCFSVFSISPKPFGAGAVYDRKGAHLSAHCNGACTRPLKRRQTAFRPDTIAGGNLGKLVLVFRQLRAIGFGMPEMDHARRKHAFLAAYPRVQQAYDDIRIFLAPASVVGIKPVDAIEVGTPDCEITRPCVFPNALTNSAQRSKRQIKKRRQSIDSVMPTLGHPARDGPRFRPKLFSQYFRREFG